MQTERERERERKFHSTSHSDGHLCNGQHPGADWLLSATSYETKWTMDDDQQPASLRDYRLKALLKAKG